MKENENRKTMYEQIPEVAKLNKVPGFNPLQFLRPVISEKTQERLFKLDLRYQKLWFRLAHPKGKMKLNALRITDQMAIFEAQIYFDRSDNEPASSFVASLSREDTLDYIKAAQEKALNTALSDAGFGLQFADVSVGKEGEPYGCLIPAVDMQTETQEEKVEKKQTVSPTARNVQTQSQTEMANKQESQPVVAKTEEQQAEKLPVTPTAEKAGVASQSMTQIKAETLSIIPTEENSQMEKLPVTKTVEKMQAESLPVTPTAGKAVSQSQSVKTVVEPMKEETLPVMPTAEKSQTEKLPVAQAVEEPLAESLPAASTAGETVSHSQSVTTAMEAAKTESLPVTPMVEKTVLFVRPTEQATAAQQQIPTDIQQATSLVSTPVTSVIEQQVEVAPRYTADMTVEEITALMTYEEAQAVKVDKGICAGWTVGEVADKRTPSLKFYLYGNDSNNILRAAAKIMLDSLTGQKAG